MKNKVLLWFGLCIQCAFLIFWVVRAPGPAEEIAIAQDELQKGNADLPGLIIYNDGLETRIAYDSTKSVCENLMTRTKARLFIAGGEFESILRIPLFLGLSNVILLIVLLRSLRTKAAAGPPL
jgi:hypothetical protein